MVQLKGTLKHGLKVGEGASQKVYKDYVLRPAGVADMFDAEDLAPVSKTLSYKGALLGRQLVKLGEMSGPIDMSLIRKLHPDDFYQLTQDMKKVDEMGEVESGD
jgi:phage FluMu protein gp41